MSTFDKTMERLFSRPTDFTWNELKTILWHVGYIEKKGKGSRRKFIHCRTKHTICLHEPHPRPVVKRYVLNEVIEVLVRQHLL